MSRPCSKRLARNTDQRLAADVRQISTTDLRRERDRLRNLLTNSPASPTNRISAPWEQRQQAETRLREAEGRSTHGKNGLFRPIPDPGKSSGEPLEAQARRTSDQAATNLIRFRRQEQERAVFLERHVPEASRYHAIIRELAWRCRADAHALEIEQPGYLVNALGAVPMTSHARRAWRSAATQIEAYRDSYGIADPDDALGPEPQGDLLRRKAWHTCRVAIDHQWRDERQGRALPRADREEQQRELS